MFATLAGGFPRPPDRSPDEELAAVLADQVEAGLGLLSDGLVHSGDETPDELVAAWLRTRAAAAGRAPGMPVKLALVGPCAGASSAASSVPAEVAVRLNRGVMALVEAGCPFLEVHEPAATLPAGDAGRAAFVQAHAALLDGAGDRIHAALAITGGDAVAVGAPALFASPYRSHLFDLLDGPESWRLVAAAPGDRGIVVGVGDASGRRRTRIEDVVWAAGYAASTGGRGIQRVGIAPSGGLEGLDRERALEVIGLLGDAAAAISEGGEAVLARLDPRAIDLRSAALGYHGPRRSQRPTG